MRVLTGRLRVLLSEASSLTAREHLTVLRTAGVQVEAMSSDPFALCRWSAAQISGRTIAAYSVTEQTNTRLHQ